MNCGIEKIAINLPGVRLPLAQAVGRSERPEPDRAIVDRLGIETVHVAEGQSSHELAVRAVDLVLEASVVDRTQIGLVVLVPGRAPERLIASDLTRLQAEAGLSEALAISIGDLGCASSSTALLVCDRLFASDPSLTHAIVAHGSTTATGDRFRRPVTAVGDCGAAMLLSRTPLYRFERWAQRTNGAYWDLFAVQYRDRDAKQWVEECRDERVYSFQLAMDSKRELTEMVGEILSAGGLEMGDIDHLVLQNLSDGAFRFWEQAFDRPVASVCRENLASLGHLGAADVPANLYSLAPRVRPGDRVLVLNSSPAAAWTAGLLHVGVS